VGLAQPTIDPESRRDGARILFVQEPIALPQNALFFKGCEKNCFERLEASGHDFTGAEKLKE
jgi:hypothetical protein